MRASVKTSNDQSNHADKSLTIANLRKAGVINSREIVATIDANISQMRSAKCRASFKMRLMVYISLSLLALD